MKDITVLSLGGSIISPDNIDVEFVRSFTKAVSEYLEEDSNRHLIIVTGGGAPARVYQHAYKTIVKEPIADLLDEIGIAATRLNAALIRAAFSSYCDEEVVTDPTAEIAFTSRVLIASGWKPGFSSDTDAVYLAKRFGAKKVINLSNIAKVYTADPKIDPTATPIDHITWKEFRLMVGDTWIPGKNVPFDPIASKKAESHGLKVICADGRNIENTIHILKNEKFVGTVIG
ncbi:MAG: UMP kinase [Bacteroidales bacterium]|jgi:uridylate kinase|nr:UMP kinase [Bacteroidales bacterium]